MVLLREQGNKLVEHFKRVAPDVHFSNEPNHRGGGFHVVAYTDRDNDDAVDAMLPALRNSDEVKAIVGRSLTGQELYSQYVPL